LKHNKISLFILFILALGVTIWAFIFTTRTNDINISKYIGITKDNKISKEKKVAEDEYEDYVIDQKDIQNILLIGVDEGGYENARSDVMIIVTIDSDSNVIKLTSVMRDTLVHIPTSNTYQKLNHSYMEGGPTETMAAINNNFDLNIENYVVFDFNAVKKSIDLVGGYPVNISTGEAKDMKISKGPRTLTGQEALSYMRVRYNSGGNAGRNQRQRDLILYILNYAKNMNYKELIELAINIMPDIKTSYSLKDISELINIYIAIIDGLQTEQYNFPYEYQGTRLNDGLWYAVPRTMRTNVIELQKNTFGFIDYIPSNTVDNISEQVSVRSNVK